MILMTPRQVQQELQISRTLLYQWMKSGRIPTVKLGKQILRVPKEILEQKLAEGGLK